MPKNTKFMENLWFFSFSINLMENRKTNSRFRYHFHIFAPARPPRSDAYKRNGISSFLRSPGALGAFFRKNADFCEIWTKNAKFNFSVNSIKFFKFCFFCENTCMSKTPIIPKEYQGFGASGLSKTQNFNKFPKFHVFS